MTIGTGRSLPLGISGRDELNQGSFEFVWNCVKDGPNTLLFSAGRDGTLHCGEKCARALGLWGRCEFFQRERAN